MELQWKTMGGGGSCPPNRPRNFCSVCSVPLAIRNDTFDEKGVLLRQWEDPVAMPDLVCDVSDDCAPNSEKKQRHSVTNFHASSGCVQVRHSMLYDGARAMASKHVSMTAHASSAGRASGLFSQHRALDEPECVASSGICCHPQRTVSSTKLRLFSEPPQENYDSEAMHQRYGRYMCIETTTDKSVRNIISRTPHSACDFPTAVWLCCRSNAGNQIMAQCQCNAIC